MFVDSRRRGVVDRELDIAVGIDSMLDVPYRSI